MKITQSCLTLCNPMDYTALFYRPEYWSEETFPSPGDLPNPGIEPRSHVLQVDSLPAEPQGKPQSLIYLDQENIWTQVSFSFVFWWAILTTYSCFKNKFDFPGGPVVGICLPMKGTQVQSLVWEDSTCLGTTKPMCHNYLSPCATTTEALTS